MTAKKKNSFITAELEFAEFQLQSWKQYILDNPIDKITDRRGEKELPNGQIARNAILSTKEQIIKSVQDTMEKYLKMLAVVDDLRAKEEAKSSNVRGGGTIPPRMQIDTNDET